MLKAQIIAEDEQGHLPKLFASEEREFPNGRASYTITKAKGKTVFDIEAHDSTALRAVMTSITKLLMTYEKAKAIKNG